MAQEAGAFQLGMASLSVLQQITETKQGMWLTGSPEDWKMGVEALCYGCT